MNFALFGTLELIPHEPSHDYLLFSPFLSVYPSLDLPKRLPSPYNFIHTGHDPYISFLSAFESAIKCELELKEATAKQ